MEIKIIGAGCEKCDKLYENVNLALKELNMEARIEKVEDLMDIVRLGVMTTPALMVNGQVIVSGRVAGVKDIVKLLGKIS